MSANNMDLVVVVCNEGYADLVMQLAKDAGARGGTIFSANGSLSPNTAKLYGIEIHPEKEVVFIISNHQTADKILSTIYDNAGSESPAMSIAFTLPVNNASSNLVDQFNKKEKEK